MALKKPSIAARVAAASRAATAPRKDDELPGGRTSPTRTGCAVPPGRSVRRRARAFPRASARSSPGRRALPPNGSGIRPSPEGRGAGQRGRLIALSGELSGPSAGALRGLPGDGAGEVCPPGRGAARAGSSADRVGPQRHLPARDLVDDLQVVAVGFGRPDEVAVVPGIEPRTGAIAGPGPASATRPPARRASTRRLAGAALAGPRRRRARRRR